MQHESDTRFIWTQRGDHSREGDRLIEKNLRENGRLVGLPSVIVRKYPGGVFTLLSASGIWWRDEMRLHPAWGEPMRDEADYFDLLDGVGDKRTESSGDLGAAS